MAGKTIAALLLFVTVVNPQCNICSDFNQNECCNDTGLRRCCSKDTRNNATCPASDNTFSTTCRFRCIADGQCPPGQKCCPPTQRLCIPNAQLSNFTSTTSTSRGTSTTRATTETTSATTAASGRRRRQSQSTNQRCPTSIAQATVTVLTRCNGNGTCPSNFTCCPAPVQVGCCVASA